MARAGAIAVGLNLLLVLAACNSQPMSPLKGNAAALRRDCIAQLWRQHVAYRNGLPPAIYCDRLLDARDLAIERARKHSRE